MEMLEAQIEEAEKTGHGSLVEKWRDIRPDSDEEDAESDELTWEQRCEIEFFNSLSPAELQQLLEADEQYFQDVADRDDDNAFKLHHGSTAWIES